MLRDFELMGIFENEKEAYSKNYTSMTSLSFNTTINNEQLYSLLNQLTTAEKFELSNFLRAQACQEEWALLSNQLPDTDEITEEDILNEIKAYRIENSIQQD
jgi:hypothetical protein